MNWVEKSLDTHMLGNFFFLDADSTYSTKGNKTKNTYNE